MNQRITTIKFSNYKSFKSYSVKLNDFNILVGPNNAGKSTIIGALKILSVALKKAKTKNPTVFEGENSFVTGYELDIDQIPITTENVFHNYNDDEPAVITFYLLEPAESYLQIVFISNTFGYMVVNPVIHSCKEFRRKVNIEIGYVPILGPVEHKEMLYQKEAARLALITHRASRNFRNIWYHYKEDFETFRELIKTTWAGMDIQLPEVQLGSGKENSILNMFCPEERLDREIYWAGFGFQVWCQMLTFILKNKNATLFLIDEPDIYLHSELQRQLLGILKELGPAIIIATHSTELICEADSNDILIINKQALAAKRIKDTTQLRSIFRTLGSNLNPVLTQIAKSKRVLFVEGNDFMILLRFAKILDFENVTNRKDFAVVPLQGFNPTKLRAVKEGIEKAIGSLIISAVIFDRDYRHEKEITDLKLELDKGNIFAHIHSRKEIENFLLLENALDKAIRARLKDKKIEDAIDENFNIRELLASVAEGLKPYTQSQIQGSIMEYEKKENPKYATPTLLINSLNEFERQWSDFDKRLMMVSGKEFITQLNVVLRAKLSISITYPNIMSSITKSDIMIEMKDLIAKIEQFRTSPIPK